MAVDFSTIQIEAGIPIPPRATTGTQIDAVLRSLQVGHSFVIPFTKNREVWGKRAKALGIKLAVRASEDKQQLRIWRAE